MAPSDDPLLRGETISAGEQPVRSVDPPLRQPDKETLHSLQTVVFSIHRLFFLPDASTSFLPVHHRVFQAIQTRQ